MPRELRDERPQEMNLARYLEVQAEFRSAHDEFEGLYGALLKLHYTKPGMAHPDDVYYPLNKWEEIKLQDERTQPGAQDPGPTP